MFSYSDHDVALYSYEASVIVWQENTGFVQSDIKTTSDCLIAEIYIIQKKDGSMSRPTKY